MIRAYIYIFSSRTTGLRLSTVETTQSPNIARTSAKPGAGLAYESIALSCALFLLFGFLAQLCNNLILLAPILLYVLYEYMRL